MKELTGFLRYWLWDRWHGVSVSAFDERRALDSSTPDIEIGGARILPRRVIQLLIVVLTVIAVGGLVLWIGRITPTTTRALEQISRTSACTGADSTGRIYIALDCLLLQMAQFLATQAPVFIILALTYAAGFFHGWMRWGRK